MGAPTMRFAVLGDPVAHSLSPRFQNAGFRAAGLNARYVALPCNARELATTVAGLAGGNITLPHKNAAATLPGVRHPRVDTIGVANTFANGPDGLVLWNTDVDGVLASLDRLEAPASGWLLIGTGGSARAVVAAAAERGAKIAVQSRSPERAAAFAAWGETLGVESMPAEECELAINATPVGLTGSDGLVLDPTAWPALRLALDLTYRTDGTTPWVERCRAHGLSALDGRHMLVVQGAASWALWFPGITPPLAVMEAALDGSLE